MWRFTADNLMVATNGTGQQQTGWVVFLFKKVDFRRFQGVKSDKRIKANRVFLVQLFILITVSHKLEISDRNMRSCRGSARPQAGLESMLYTLYTAHSREDKGHCDLNQCMVFSTCFCSPVASCGLPTALSWSSLFFYWAKLWEADACSNDSTSHVAAMFSVLFCALPKISPCKQSVGNLLELWLEAPTSCFCLPAVQLMLRQPRFSHWQRVLAGRRMTFFKKGD